MEEFGPSKKIPIKYTLILSANVGQYIVAYAKASGRIESFTFELPSAKCPYNRGHEEATDSSTVIERKASLFGKAPTTT